MVTDEKMVTDARNDKIVFWGCFLALITTAFGFITRAFLVPTWADEFNLDQASAGRLFGIGIWPFAVSIIAFSLFIDKIGYKTAMIIAFLGHLAWAVIGVAAYFVSQSGDPDTAFQMIYWGSLVLALANGTVEAFINPVVATMFTREKTKWLNILHAGWPGGLVIAGIIVIFMGDLPWGAKVGIIGAPAIIYFLALIPRRFPVHERVGAGVSYREMLSEFGILGALVVGFLVTLQLMDFASDGGQRMLPMAEQIIYVLIGVGIVVGFGAYTRSLGRPLMFVLVLIMMPLATTELGTDGLITDMLKGVAKDKFDPGWVLVYTSVIMMILRFFAGPIVHMLSPLGLLCVSSILAIAGLATLSITAGMMIFAAATLYGVGKTFFWPTMLGVVAEQTPKGGALTLNAIAGIGMLTVGTLGTTYIGSLQDGKQIEAIANSDLAKEIPGLVENGSLTVIDEKSKYEIIKYETIDDTALNLQLLEKLVSNLPVEQRDAFHAAVKSLPSEAPHPDDANETIDKQMLLLKQIASLPFPANKEVAKLLSNEKLSSGERAQIAMAVAAIEQPKPRGEIEDLIESLPEGHRDPVADYAAQRAALNQLLLDLSPDHRSAVKEVMAEVDGELADLKGRMKAIRDQSDQRALMNMTVFPAIMLFAYILLILYFRSKGGYDEQVLTGHAAKDEDFTGGVERPVE